MKRRRPPHQPPPTTPGPPPPPPTLDAAQAAKRLEGILTADPPQGARVVYEPVSTGNGFHAPLEAEWLNEAVHTASLTYFDQPAAHRGEGGSIQLIAVSERMLMPKGQFHAAHGPDHLTMKKEHGGDEPIAAADAKSKWTTRADCGETDEQRAGGVRSLGDGRRCAQRSVTGSKTHVSPKISMPPPPP